MTSISEVQKLLIKDRRYNNKLRLLTIFLLGDDRDPVRQSNLLFALTVSAFAIVALIFNIVSDVAAPNLNWIVGLQIIANSWLWYQGRWHDNVRLTTNGVLLITAFLSVPATWFFNGGSDGPALIIFSAALTYNIGVYKSGERLLKLSILGLLVLPPSLLFLESKYPQLIHGYTSSYERIIDLLISYLMCSAALGVLIFGHTRRFIQELKSKKELTDELRELATQDSLTKLLNHRSILDAAEQYRLDNTPFCVMLIDIDYFKNVNDQHGHQVGDIILIKLAQIMSDIVNSVDGKVGRLGGEEFLVVAPINTAKMLQIDNRLRHALMTDNELTIPITYSAGISYWSAEQTIDHLISLADDAMYRAKADGRNQTATN